MKKEIEVKGVKVQVLIKEKSDYINRDDIWY
jgi:hypothetical protein